MLRIAAITCTLLLIGSSGLTIKTPLGVSLLQTEPPQSAARYNEAVKETPDDIFHALIPRWMSEAVAGVSMFPTDLYPKEIVPPTIPLAVEPKEAQETLGDLLPLPTSTKCIVIICIQCMVVYAALLICRTCHEFSGTRRGKVDAALKAAAQTLSYGPMICALFIACRTRVEFLSDGKDKPAIWVLNCMYAVTFAVMASTVVVLFIPLVTGRATPLKEHLKMATSRSISDPLTEMLHYFDGPDITEDDSKLAFYALTVMRYLILIGFYGGLAGLIVSIRTYVPVGVSDVTKLPTLSIAEMCTIILAVVFFVAQLIIAGCRTYEEFTGTEFPTIVGVMNAAATTAEFAPMLAILFLSAHMRALQHNDQPQVWAQSCMIIATAALCVALPLAVLVPLLMGGQMKLNLRTRERTFVVPDPMLGYFFMSLRFTCMIGFYAGAAGVVYSIFAFEAPVGSTLPVPPCVQCIVALTCQFFFVYFMMTVMLTVSEVSGGEFPLQSYRFSSAIEASKVTLAFAPVLSTLFAATRMYALLITHNRGAPQAWVQVAMFVATGSLLMTFLACLCTGLVDKVQTDMHGQVVNKFSNKHAALAITILRYAMMLLLYASIASVVVGIFVMTSKTANGQGSAPLVADDLSASPVSMLQTALGPNDVANLAGF